MKNTYLENSAVVDAKLLGQFLNGDAPHGGVPEISVPSLLAPINPTPAQHKSVMELLQAMQKAENARGDRAEAFQQKIDSMLSKYPLCLTVQRTKGGWAGGIIALRQGFHATEAHIAAMLHELFCRGKISLVRRCEGCERWFLASRPNKTFHSDACWRQKARSTDEFKSKAAQYQKKRYDRLYKSTKEER